MKIEYCETTIRNPCSDQKWCCDRLRNFYRNGQMMIYQGKYCLWENDQRMSRMLTPIDFCPFCGEKIET